jgi:TonB family protein
MLLKANYRLFLQLSLCGFIILFTSHLYGAEIKNNSKLEVKRIGYSTIKNDISISKEFSRISNEYTESVMNSCNDNGLISVYFCPVELNYYNPDIEKLSKICNKLDLDAFLISKLQFSTYVDSGLYKARMNTEKAIISMKLYDRNGNFIDSAYYDSQKSTKKYNPIVKHGLTDEVVREAILKLFEKINCSNSNFSLDVLTQKIWQSFRIFGKDGCYQEVAPASRLNLCLYNNSSYFLEVILDSSTDKPKDEYIYKPQYQEIVLKSALGNLSFKILGFNEQFLILSPIGVENISKIYFKRVSLEEYNQILKRSKEIIKKRAVLDSIVPNKNQSDIDGLDGPVYFVVEHSASFQGGDLNDFRHYVAKNIVYPRVAQERSMTGTVIVEFVIAPSGKLKAAKVIRSSGWTILDNEALRVLNSSPLWKPAIQDGKQVMQLFTMPVSFK